MPPLTKTKLKEFLQRYSFEFPIKEIKINMPGWINSLEKEHWLKSSIYTCIKNSAKEIEKVNEIQQLINALENCEYITGTEVSAINLGNGSANIKISLEHSSFLQNNGRKNRHRNKR